MRGQPDNPARDACCESAAGRWLAANPGAAPRFAYCLCASFPVNADAVRMRDMVRAAVLDAGYQVDPPALTNAMLRALRSRGRIAGRAR